MNKSIEKLLKQNWVLHIDDERADGNGIIVTLQKGWEFVADRGCAVRGFDTVSDARNGTARSEVRQTE